MLKQQTFGETTPIKKTKRHQNMARRRIHKSPRYTELLLPTFNALKAIGGSGTNEEIHEEMKE